MRRLFPRAFACFAVAGVLGSDPSMAQQTAAPTDPGSIADLLTESAQRLADGDYEGAIRDASLALQLDPKNPAAYEARGTIYIQERLWDRAERDYTMAAKLSPDIVYKYKLAEIAFFRKTYEDAASRFAALEMDPNLGDLAYYEAFLSDLLGGHEAKANRELTDRDRMPVGPSLFFCHAAWDLYHEDRVAASKAFAAAAKLYEQSVCERYISSLIETRRFQLAAVTFTDRNGTAYSNASAFLESSGLRVSTKHGWITLTLDQLPDDLTAFPEDLREQIDRKRAVRASTTESAPASLLTFNTRSGQRYEQVRWSLEENGLSVLTADGWIPLSLGELPTDTTAFPPELQHAIEEKRRAPSSIPVGLASVAPVPVTFTTKLGKDYHDVKAMLAKDGVHVLTADGWIAVPFGELPDDLSTFPPEWFSGIQAGRTSVPDASEVQVVSFTTLRGVHYDQVRASMDKGGLRLMTPDGLVSVPFNQLPPDDSTFPEEWREAIAAKEKEVLKTTPP